ncbi:MAG: ABC transporter substrate-binding protein [Halomonas sp.]|nr:MAG: ABC transporter substrate-binding protein [Halomonas sp.]
MPLSAMPLMINTEEYPPFNYSDEQGKIVGSATLLLRSALSQADIDAHFRVLPWARAYTEARLSAHHCVYSTTRTPERETLFRWVGPLVVNEWAAFSLAGRELNIPTLTALSNWRVGSFREDAVGDYVESQGVNVFRAPSERENIARLKAGLLDVIVTGKATGEFMAEEKGIALEHLFTFAYAPLYLACHPSVSEELLARLQIQLDALRTKTEGNQS